MVAITRQQTTSEHISFLGCHGEQANWIIIMPHCPGDTAVAVWGDVCLELITLPMSCVWQDMGMLTHISLEIDQNVIV